MDAAKALLDLVRRNMASGDFDVATDTLRRAESLFPDHPDLYLLRANLPGLAKDMRLNAICRALALAPGTGTGWSMLGQAGIDPLTTLGRACRVDPFSHDSREALGLKLFEVADSNGAVKELSTAVALAPETANLTHNLGCILLAQGNFESARQLFHCARLVDPGLADAWINEGVCFQNRAKHHEALACYESAQALVPDSENFISNKGFVLRELDRPEEAVAFLTENLARHPHFADVQLQLALALRTIGATKQAIHHLRAAICLRPDKVEPYSNDAQTLVGLCHAELAQRSAERACLLVPNSMTFTKSRLFVSSYDPALSVTTFNDIIGKTGQQMRNALGNRRLYSFSNGLNPDQRLSIGYLSSDFRDHPVMRNLMPLLPAKGRAGTVADHRHVLFNLGLRHDHVTAEIAGRVDAIIQIAGLLDDQIADRIRSENIDILVILAGRFDDNRLWIGHLGPAPVVVSMCDVATTGFDATDYFLADPIVVPRITGTFEPEFFAERVIRLPHVYAHDPIQNAPAIGPPPCMNNGYLTFGSFNNPAKINAKVLTLWARILNAVPQSRMVLHYRNAYVDPDLQRDITTRLGVAADRVRFSTQARFDLADHLSAYGEIDVGLDPFPFNGSTTTFEALWMGVPVLGPIGDRMISRWNASLMQAAGLSQLIGQDGDDVIRLCWQLDRDRIQLQNIRAATRARLAKSYVCNASLRKRHIDRLYRAMWRSYCSQQFALERAAEL